MRWIVQHVGAAMVLRPLEEHLEGDAVMQVFAKMNLVANIHALLVREILDRLPALRQLVKGGSDKTCRTLRPRMDEGRASLPE